ncbi:hypothetical protein OHA37_26370 [Streptomyces sp. NBC_00335]|uniref:hypothetical protein n=1 Tax=unclassified Streptomyces TaxID=2593676 RepID=UPI00224FF118|nr:MULTISPECIES: hypothetical protein [unclassified Streptomyces]MCX5407378.1 hypothetical protein [Streptomyces sp. NBC_00086]
MTAVTREQIPVLFEGNGAELRVQELGGGFSVAFGRFAKGVDMTPAFKGLPDDLCPCPHYAYVIKGRIMMHTKDGDEVYSAGEACYWAPGHAPVALEDTEYLDFSPTEEFRAVVEHVKAQLA